MYHVHNSAPTACTWHVHINSTGGSVTEGIRLMDGLITTGVINLTTELQPMGYSMGALLFMVGGKRVVTSHSDMMIHNYSAVAFGKGGEIIDAHNHHGKQFNALLVEYFVDPGYITKEEYTRILDGKDLWLTADEMCKRGIATHIEVNGVFMTVESYLKTAKDRNPKSKPKPVAYTYKQKRKQILALLKKKKSITRSDVVDANICSRSTVPAFMNKMLKDKQLAIGKSRGSDKITIIYVLR